MMKKALAFLLFNIFASVCIFGQTPSGAYSSPATGSTSPGSAIASPSLNNNAWYLSQNCGAATNCTQIKGDGKVVTDATSTSTTTVTCPNSDCHFLTTAVGGGLMKVWATTQGSGAGVGLLTFTTTVCPVTTIATVVNDSTITLNAACTASGTANVVLIWGTDDGAVLHALNQGCVTYTLPQNAFILTSRGFLTTSPTCVNAGLATGTGYPTASMAAPQSTSTVFIMTPDFTWADCTGVGAVSGGVCIGSGLNQMQNFLVWGTGLTSAANANCANGANKTVLAAIANGGFLSIVNLSGICPGTTGLTGVELNSLDEKWFGGGAQEVGEKACVTSSRATETEILDCHNLLVPGANAYGHIVLAGAQQNDYGTAFYVRSHILGTLTSKMSHFAARDAATQAVLVESGGVWNTYSDFINTDVFGDATQAIQIVSGGTVNSTSTTYNASSAQIINGGRFNDLGGNTATGAGGIGSFSTALWIGQGILQGSCAGTITSAATVGLYQLGQFTTPNCTSTTVNLGKAMSASGTAQHLACFSGTAGNQATSACTVVKNGTPQALTCSMNGVTTCTDNTAAHKFAYVQGDVISVQIVGGTADTLANVKAIVIAW